MRVLCDHIDAFPMTTWEIIVIMGILLVIVSYPWRRG